NYGAAKAHSAVFVARPTRFRHIVARGRASPSTAARPELPRTWSIDEVPQERSPAKSCHWAA
ncbi:MAG: hypothetical protein ACRELF_25355, partial [Gemmataceae bacterium]